jgi:2-amino-4-hydroxy-6-hydroxymethyldihydropteridine diphosphokinase
VTTLAYVGLGSNLAHPRRRIARALQSLARLPGTTVVRVSRNYRSAPIGTPGEQPDYVNAVAALSTSLSPRALLTQLLVIERRQGRRRTLGAPRNAARTLDLDLLLYGGRRLHGATLTIPHPRMHERAFVLRPLLDIAPAARIPRKGLARSLDRGLRSQRIAPTRRHYLH